jgi:hypothetical protein
MNKKPNAGVNDPARWASPPAGLDPESFMEHEDFTGTTGFILPFDICLELCEGNKVKARALHYGQWAKLRTKENDDE